MTSLHSLYTRRTPRLIESSAGAIPGAWAQTETF